MSRRTLITFLFWAGAVALLTVALLAADAMGWPGLCLLLGLAVLSVLAVVSYFVRRLIWGKEEEPEEVPVRNQLSRKELGKVKRQSDANTAALLQYIHDALRDGAEEGNIKSSLLGKGWPEEMVGEAFRAYKEILAKYPLPAKGLKA